MKADVRRDPLPKNRIEHGEVSAQELAKRKKRQFEKAFSSDSGVYLPHVYQVFSDPDFRHDIEVLRSKIESLYYTGISLDTKGDDEHLLKEDKLLIKQVADEYCITLDDLGIYADGYFDLGGEYGRRTEEYGGISIYGDVQPHRICYVIGPKTTIQQIKRDWKYIKAMRTLVDDKENTKSKSPQSPDLIYAIFKARTKYKQRFSEIFRRYQAGKLEGYEGKNTSQFNSEDSLERYYRRFMPQKQYNNIEAPLIPTEFKTAEELRNQTDT